MLNLFIIDYNDANKHRGGIKTYTNNLTEVANTEKTSQGNRDTYLVKVKFDNGLKTNYGASLNISQETKGTAEIVVNSRKLIYRFFDNLKYTFNK
ncbi:MAG: hypothetical protein ACK5NB_13725 [Flavobacteriaceae bacterium]